MSPNELDLEILHKVSYHRVESTDKRSLETYLFDIKVTRYRSCGSDRNAATVWVPGYVYTFANVTDVYPAYCTCRHINETKASAKAPGRMEENINQPISFQCDLNAFQSGGFGPPSPSPRALTRWTLKGAIYHQMLKRQAEDVQKTSE